MTAIPSRVRQLVDGVWQYVTFDEGGGGGGSPTVILSATVNILASQVLNLVSAGVTLVAEPGPNKVLFPLRVASSLDFNTTAYNVTGGEEIQVVLGDPLGASTTVFDLSGVTSAFSTYITSTDDATLPYTDTSAIPGSYSAFVQNKPLSLINFGDEIINGDSPITMTVEYSVIDTF